MTDTRKVTKDEEKVDMNHAHPATDWTTTPNYADSIHLLSGCCDATFNFRNFRKEESQNQNEQKKSPKHGDDQQYFRNGNQLLFIHKYCGHWELRLKNACVY